MCKLKITMLCITASVLFFISCSDKKPVENLQSIKLGNETITAGNYFRLTSLHTESIIIKGKEFSENNIKFKCVSLMKESEVEYKGAVSTQASSGNKTVTETTAVKEFERWPAGMIEKEISIKYIYMPTLYAYTGEGFLYFYLVDKENKCISNIIRLVVKFI